MKAWIIPPIVVPALIGLGLVVFAVLPALP
jgi:hypothetical protein